MITLVEQIYMYDKVYELFFQERGSAKAVFIILVSKAQGNVTSLIQLDRW